MAIARRTFVRGGKTIKLWRLATGEWLGSLDGGDRSRQSDFSGRTDGPVLGTSWPFWEAVATVNRLAFSADAAGGFSYGSNPLFCSIFVRGYFLINS